MAPFDSLWQWLLVARSTEFGAQISLYIDLRVACCGIPAPINVEPNNSSNIRLTDDE
jgi:hypothetical protein